MMKTRPKRKAQEGTSQSDVSLTIFMPEDIDVATLSNLLPDTSITSPSSDAIITLYRLLLAQNSELEGAQQELENVQAEAEKKDVELDQALQDKESGIKDMEGQVEAAQEELKKVRAERDELGMFPIEGLLSIH